MWRSLKSKIGEQSKGNRALHFKVRKFCTVESNVRKCNTRCEFPKANFRTPLFKVRKFSHRAKHPPGTRSVISHTSRQFSHSANQCAKISHTTIQGAKFIPTCENHCLRGATSPPAQDSTVPPSEGGTPSQRRYPTRRPPIDPVPLAAQAKMPASRPPAKRAKFSGPGEPFQTP
ncbi:hypothetical protein CK203_044392 [Vitis vinifera]|uniref:Uncharacterized protein n=1 Tax=Vitis vinifera TaxID=29760 RepID=A0A438HUE6_VITVI|nr:hypothetical protein CK203_044392 [Vitis vinifera]